MDLWMTRWMDGAVQYVPSKEGRMKLGNLFTGLMASHFSNFGSRARCLQVQHPKYMQWLTPWNQSRLQWYQIGRCSDIDIKWYFMMTSSNGNIFRVTGPLCEWNPPVTSGFPSQRPVTRGFDAFFDLRLNKWLTKQSRRNRAHYDVTVMFRFEAMRWSPCWDPVHTIAWKIIRVGTDRAQ